MIEQQRSIWQAVRVRCRRHPLITLLAATVVLVVGGTTAVVVTAGGDSDGNSGFWGDLVGTVGGRHHDSTGCGPSPPGRSVPRSCSPSAAAALAAGHDPAIAARGWSSGASGLEARDGRFSSWRRSPVTMIGTWADADAATQAEMYALMELSGWNGDIDIAIGGTDLTSDEDYERAAAGVYLERWKQQAVKLQQARAGKAGITYVRPFHEFNGDWYTGWQVTSKNLASYKAAFTLMAKTIREACPVKCKIVWSPNNDTSAGSASVSDAYPGDTVVDVIGVDYYNAHGNVVANTRDAWVRARDVGTVQEPVGPEKWRQFAQARGKPLAFPEWGLRPEGGGGDDVEFIRGMHEFMSRHAAHPGERNIAGKVVYDVYFNVPLDSDQFLIMGGPNVRSSALYQNLRWGTATFLN